MDELFLGMIFGFIIGFLAGLVCSDSFFNYLTFKKQQEFEKEKYYSEYAENYLRGARDD